MKPILEDKRKIKAVYWIDAENSQIIADETWQIVAYPEPGQGGYVPWVAISKNGVVVMRVPAHILEIYYDDD